MKKLLLLLFSAVLLFSVPPHCAAVTQAVRDELDQRTAELIPALSQTPAPLIPPITDRQAWEEFAQYPANRKIIAEAESFLTTPIPELSEDLYKEFHRNGNRSHYEQPFSKIRERLNVLAIAELIENKGRFIPALEGTIRFFLGYPSWSLPAHDSKAEIYDQKREGIDLISSIVSADLGIIRQAMGGKLNPELSEQIVQNIRRRTLEPFRREIESDQKPRIWWFTTTNNWNPVCFCNAILAVLSVCETPQERAQFLAAAEYFVSTYYFRGFTEDGYCSEGLSYWDYGLGRFAILAEVSYRVTGGTMNLYAVPKLPAAAEYPRNIEVVSNIYAAFADSPVTAKPSIPLQSLLSRRLGLGWTEIEKAGSPPEIGTAALIDLPAFFFLPPGLGSAVPNPRQSSPSSLNEPYSYFADAGVLICRGVKDDPAQISAVFKGGHNGEHHNHNDLGTFGIVRGKEWLVIDPGKEKYTARTFSSDRYKGELLSSYGHSVPQINGKLQKAGKSAKAAVLESRFTETETDFTLDLTSAYPDSGLTLYTRSFHFEQASEGTPNKITVTDRFTFNPDSPKELEIPFVTFQTWASLSDNSIRIFPKKSDEPGVTISLTAYDETETPVTGVFTEKTIGENDDSVPQKPTRIIWTSHPETGNTVTVISEISPEN